MNEPSAMPKAGKLPIHDPSSSVGLNGALGFELRNDKAGEVQTRTVPATTAPIFAKKKLN